MSKKDKIMTLTEAAQIAGLDPRTLRRAADTGALKATKINPRMWVTTEKDLYDFLSKRKPTNRGRPKKPHE